MIFPDKYTAIKDSLLGQLAIVIKYLKQNQESSLDDVLNNIKQTIKSEYSELKLGVILFILYKLELLDIVKDNSETPKLRLREKG